MTHDKPSPDGSEGTDMATTDADKVAALLKTEMEAGLERGMRQMCSLFADVIEMHHRPPLVPGDGPMAGAELGRITEAETAALLQSVPDLSNERIDVEVDGSRLHVVSTARGTRDGDPIEITSDMTLEVHDGRITSMLAVWDQDGASRSALTDALAAGGFEIPAEGRAIYDKIGRDE
jgi:ketosteroid isomerase-like protein